MFRMARRRRRVDDLTMNMRAMVVAGMLAAACGSSPQGTGGPAEAEGGAGGTAGDPGMRSRLPAAPEPDAGAPAPDASAPVAPKMDGPPAAMPGPEAGVPSAIVGRYGVDVKPILSVKCAPCHLVGGSAAIFHTMASSYADVMKDAVACPGKRKGECALIRVKNGSMPSQRNCAGDGSSTSRYCLNRDDIAHLEAWVAGGLRE